MSNDENSKLAKITCKICGSWVKNVIQEKGKEKPIQASHIDTRDCLRTLAKRIATLEEQQNST